MPTAGARRAVLWLPGTSGLEFVAVVTGDYAKQLMERIGSD